MKRISLLAILLTATLALAAFPPVATVQSKVNTQEEQSQRSDKLARAEAASYDFLSQRLSLYGIADVGDLQTMRLFEDKEERIHTHVQQTLGGIPVFGGEAIVHLNADGSLFAFTDNLVAEVKTDTQASIVADDAIKTALAEYGCVDCLTGAPAADLWILRHEGKDHLVYRVQLRREDGSEQTALPVYFVDAHTGELVWRYDNLQTATGISLYSGRVRIDTSLQFEINTYYMQDASRRMGTFNNQNSTFSSPVLFSDRDNYWDSRTQRAGVDAHYGAAKFWDYLYNVYGRNGIDGHGGPFSFRSADGTTRLLSSVVHYGRSYNNAFWNGQYMTYGDGDGESFDPLVTLDICGHEMMHGVTERTARLTYAGESGALNESWSDVFGAMTERSARGESSNTWRIGEQAFTPGTDGDALRYLDNPHAADEHGFTADDDPDHYSERYTGAEDDGGVHINSGIPNKVFYLLAVGGNHHRGGSMAGIGAVAAARIWYTALTTYMTSSTNFVGARTATLNAAAALYGPGSPNANAVGQAWSLCGVGAPPAANITFDQRTGRRVARNADGRQELFARGTDGNLYHKWQVVPNGGWSGWENLGGYSPGADPVVAVNADGRLEVFTRGADGTLWHIFQWVPNGGWSAWTSLGNNITGTPAVGMNQDGRLEVFARGTDDALWHIYQWTPNSGWFGWESLGGSLKSNPAVGVNRDGRLEVFVLASDGAIYHRWQIAPNSGWVGWASLGGYLISEPTVGSNADGRLEVFCIGTGGTVHHIYQWVPNGGWSVWESLGGIATSNLSTGMNQDGRLELFVRGTDGAIYHRWQQAPNSGWVWWATLSGYLISTPAVGTNADGRLEVFALGTGNTMHHIYQWVPNGGWSPWESLGGSIASF